MPVVNAWHRLLVTAVNTNKNVQREWHSAGGGIIYLLYVNGDGERKKGGRTSRVNM